MTITLKVWMAQGHFTNKPGFAGGLRRPQMQ